MMLARLIEGLEVLGGAHPLPSSWNRNAVAFIRAFWWIMLFLLVWASAGRNVKFIYVDF